MTGLFLIIFSVLAVVFFIMSFVDDYRDEGWLIASVVCFIVAIVFVIAIPISRIDSKTNAEYVKVLQETVNSNRGNQQELNVLERAAIIQEINETNGMITAWKVKGQKWYNNKWYYHPSVQKAEYVK